MLRRTPLRRKSQLKAKTPLKSKTKLKPSRMKVKPRRRVTTPDGAAHMLRVKNLPCCIRNKDCSPGELRDAHHLIGLEYKGASQKANDWQTIPLCKNHHQDGGHGVAIHAGQETWERLYGPQSHHLTITLEKLERNEDEYHQ